MDGNFGTVRNGLVYGFVRGTSMWPAFVAGDVLRAEVIHAEDATAGDVLVIQHEEASTVVHRLFSIEIAEAGLRLQTAGDRSGMDQPLYIAPETELLRITGVLRLGSWKAVPDRFPLAGMIPGLILRLHCGLVRKLQWMQRKA